MILDRKVFKRYSNARFLWFMECERKWRQSGIEGFKQYTPGDIPAGAMMQKFIEPPVVKKEGTMEIR